MKAAAIKATLALDFSQFGIPAKYWANVRSACLEIAKHYPHSAAGRERMAGDLGWSVEKFKRYLTIAVKAGLVEVTRGAGMGGRHGHFRTNVYTLQYLNRGSRMTHGPRVTSDPQSTSSPNGEELQRRGELAIPAESPEGASMPFMRPRDEGDPAGWGPAIGEDPDPDLSGTVVKLDPAKRIREHFERQWIKVVLKRDPAWAGTRIIDAGPASGYLRSKMLTHMSREHIEAYIDAFMDAVVNEAVDLKPGQSAWSRFTSWWGTVPIEDPRHAREEADLGRRMIAQARRQRAERELQQGRS